MSGSHRVVSSSDRGVSPVIGVILMVAITVLLAAVIGVFTLGFGDVQEDSPQVRTDADEFVADVGGADDQTIVLHHEGGADVAVENVEILVTFPDRSERARIVSLPVTGNELATSNYEGDDIFDRSSGETLGATSSASPDTDGVWSAGDRIRFRIKNTAVSLSPGDRVRVRIVHLPSGGVVEDRTLVAQ